MELDAIDQTKPPATPIRVPLPPPIAVNRISRLRGVTTLEMSQMGILFSGIQPFNQAITAIALS
jgi:hypothetical protein